jgi:hypothetical protein
MQVLSQVYFAPTHVTGITRDTARRRAVGAASKAASQARWLAAPENRNYWRGPVNVARVRAWRARIPATGASGGLRYKIYHWSKLLIPLTKKPISRAHRYKRSYRRNPPF